MRLGFKFFYSRCIVDSSDIRFSSNLIGCKECLFCDDLENQSYCIHNQAYEKSEYFAKKNELLKQKDKFLTWFLEIPVTGKNFASTNVTGNFVNKSENIVDGYFDYQVKDGRNVVLM